MSFKNSFSSSLTSCTWANILPFDNHWTDVLNWWVSCLEYMYLKHSFANYLVWTALVLTKLTFVWLQLQVYLSQQWREEPLGGIGSFLLYPDNKSTSKPKHCQSTVSADTHKFFPFQTIVKICDGNIEHICFGGRFWGSANSFPSSIEEDLTTRTLTNETNKQLLLRQLDNSSFVITENGENGWCVYLPEVVKLTIHCELIDARFN